MPSVSLIDGHIDGMTNYDRIRNMSIEEMAEFFASEKPSKFPSSACYICEYDYGMICLKKTNCTKKHKAKLYKKYLESEVDT